ncbi:MAG: Uma2 family endonuclease [Lewinellaceae bacterium]|nr:Uma2 family endonuclease [Lewinellaceae bacterium]
MVPDFVIEVRSPSDHLHVLKDKMKSAWIKNGVQLAWLIDPEIQQAWVFRADGSEMHVPDFQQVLSGESVLPGF